MKNYQFNEKEHSEFLKSNWTDEQRRNKIKEYVSQLEEWQEKKQDAETLLEYYDKVLWEETGNIRGDKAFKTVKEAIQNKIKEAENQMKEYTSAAENLNLPNCSAFSEYEETSTIKGNRMYTPYFGWGNLVDVFYLKTNSSKIVVCPDELRCNGCCFKLCKRNESRS